METEESKKGEVEVNLEGGEDNKDANDDTPKDEGDEESKKKKKKRRSTKKK